MITNGFYFLALILFLSGLTIYTEHKHPNSKFFTYIPSLIIIYFGVMILSSLHVWDMTSPSVSSARNDIKDVILPAMIFLMLLKADLRDIAQLGTRMIVTFFVASTTITIAFILGFLMLKQYLSPNAPNILGTLAGSWFGGWQNMAAVQQALDVHGADMGYALLIDSIDFSLWVMFLLTLVPFAKIFNKWVKADTTKVDEVTAHLNYKFSLMDKNITFQSLYILVAIAFAFTALSGILTDFLHNFEFFASVNRTASIIVMVTIIGIVCSMTPIAKIPGSSEVSNLFLYIIVGLMASTVQMSELTQAPIYIILGFVILGIHGVLMLIIGKVFKLDLFTVSIASLANIGGVASSPILAAAYSPALVPVAILMALIGVITGTFFGLSIAQILTWLS